MSSGGEVISCITSTRMIRDARAALAICRRLSLDTPFCEQPPLQYQADAATKKPLPLTHIGKRCLYKTFNKVPLHQTYDIARHGTALSGSKFRFVS